MDDVRTHVRQETGREGPRPDLGEVEHADPVEERQRFLAVREVVPLRLVRLGVELCLDLLRVLAEQRRAPQRRARAVHREWRPRESVAAKNGVVDLVPEAVLAQGRPGQHRGPFGLIPRPARGAPATPRRSAAPSGPWSTLGWPRAGEVGLGGAQGPCELGTVEQLGAADALVHGVHLPRHRRQPHPAVGAGVDTPSRAHAVARALLVRAPYERGGARALERGRLRLLDG